MRVLLAFMLLVAAPAFAQTFPKFTGLVTDAANVLPADRRAALERKLELTQQQTGNQLVVATVPSLGGDSVEDYANRLFRAWGVGLKGADNGVLLLVAPAEHQVRIEVGYRMEPVITDALSSTIIRDRIVTAFKAGDLPGGIEAGADALIDQVRQPNDVAQARVKQAQAEFDRTHKAAGSRGGGGLPLGLVFWGMIAFFLLLSFLRRRSGGAQRWSGGGGGGNWPIWLWAADELFDRDRRGGGWGGGSGGMFGGDGGSSGGSDGGWGGGGFTGGGGGSSGGGGASGGW